ncbi:MAG: hypothetical protein WB611_22225 [Stellaceae bacterium]
MTNGNNAFSLMGAYGDNEHGLRHALSAIENLGRRRADVLSPRTAYSIGVSPRSDDAKIAAMTSYVLQSVSDDRGTTRTTQ